MLYSLAFSICTVAAAMVAGCGGFGNYSSLFLTEDPIGEILRNAVRAGGVPQQIAIKANDRLVNMGILRYNELFA
jgi:hypothetical protein